ncbi:DUF4160 domain-containing protein [uncultured Sphingomonas sp.]|uniref:DUF4160 domain-containing protein n=1 Tax=uncultured Sphingomonas sp. TaxID=158754 RepID=UPI0035C9D21C
MIFVDDHPPPHVHVRGRGEARIGLDEAVSLMTNKGLSTPDIARARHAIKEARDALLSIWEQIHG